MKILQVAHGYPPHSLAGVEVYTRWFARTLASRHTVRVFSTRHLPDRDDLSFLEEDLDGIPVTFLVNNFTDYDPILEVRHPEVAERFGSFLDRIRPDLVHFQHLIKLSTTLLDACKSRGIPTVLTLHDYWFLCPVITLVQRDLTLCPSPGNLTACTRCETATSFLNREEAGTYYIAGMLEPMMASDRWAALQGIYRAGATPDSAVSTLRIGLIRRFMRDRLDVADGLASPSRFLKDILENHGLAPGHIRHLPNGIETNALKPVDRPPAPPPLRVLYLGTINKHKGVHVLIEAANRLQDLPIEVSIYGTGPDTRYDAYIRSLVENPRIRFGGRYDRGDLPALLGAHHVVAMPSIWYENYPIVIRESFAAGVPVVAPDLGAIPEAIREGRDGLLYEAGKPEALARVLVRLLREPDLLHRLEAGIEPVLGMEEHVGRYEGLYEDALKRQAEPAGGDSPLSILLCGPADSRAGFAEALGNALVAGQRRPRPEVYHLGESGDLTAPLADYLKRLDLEGAVLPVESRESMDALLDAGGPDLAVFLEGGDPGDKLRLRLESAGIPVMITPLSTEEMNRQLDHSP